MYVKLNTHLCRNILEREASVSTFTEYMKYHLGALPYYECKNGAQYLHVNHIKYELQHMFS